MQEHAACDCLHYLRSVCCETGDERATDKEGQHSVNDQGKAVELGGWGDEQVWVITGDGDEWTERAV